MIAFLLVIPLRFSREEHFSLSFFLSWVLRILVLFFFSHPSLHSLSFSLSLSSKDEKIKSLLLLIFTNWWLLSTMPEAPVRMKQRNPDQNLFLVSEWMKSECNCLSLFSIKILPLREWIEISSTERDIESHSGSGLVRFDGYLVLQTLFFPCLSSSRNKTLV